MARGVAFTFNGRTIRCAPNQTIAAALYEADAKVLSYSPKLHRPRGIYCAAGHCANCSVQVNGKPHCLSCVTPVGEGLDVRSVGVGWRSRAYRALASTPLFRLGFQYRYFKRPRWAYHIWEGQLRRGASHAPIPPPTDRTKAGRLRCDTVVIGAGPAGLGAASASTELGAETVLVSRRPRPTKVSHLPSMPEVHKRLELVASQLTDSQCRQLKPASALGLFGNLVLVECAGALIEVEARHIVIATGRYERGLTFAGNDLPGVMLLGAAMRLLFEQRVSPGKRVVILIGDDSAYDRVAALERAGVNIVACLDLRPHRDGPFRSRVKAPVTEGVTRVAAVGKSRVRALDVSAQGRSEKLSCDSVCMAGGWQSADELKPGIVSERADQPHARRSDERTSQGPLTRLVGGVLGTSHPELAFAEGQVAGYSAAELSGHPAGSQLEEALGTRDALRLESPL
jgi:thioredoxin reductase